MTLEELARALRERSEWSGRETWDEISEGRRAPWRRFAAKVASLLGVSLSGAPDESAP